MMNREEAKKALTELFENDSELFNNTIEELDSYNGYLGDDRYYSMEELDELYADTDPTEILNRAFFGYDGDYTDKDGNYTEPFNPNKPYFTFNGYGNLVSAYYKDYSAHLDDYFLDELIDNANHLYLENEVREIIDDIGEEEEEEEE